MNFQQLASHAQNAAISDYTLRTIKMLASVPGTRVGGVACASLPSDAHTAWDGMLLPAWERQMVGQIRFAARHANAFMDALQRAYYLDIFDALTQDCS